MYIYIYMLVSQQSHGYQTTIWVESSCSTFHPVTWYIDLMKLWMILHFFFRTSGKRKSTETRKFWNCGNPRDCVIIFAKNRRESLNAINFYTHTCIYKYICAIVLRFRFKILFWDFFWRNRAETGGFIQ